MRNGRLVHTSLIFEEQEGCIRGSILGPASQHNHKRVRHQVDNTIELNYLRLNRCIILRQVGSTEN